MAEGKNNLNSNSWMMLSYSREPQDCLSSESSLEEHRRDVQWNWHRRNSQRICKETYRAPLQKGTGVKAAVQWTTQHRNVKLQGTQMKCKHQGSKTHPLKQGKSRS